MVERGERGSGIRDERRGKWNRIEGKDREKKEEGERKVGCNGKEGDETCLLYTSPSPRDRQKSRMPSSA